MWVTRSDPASFIQEAATVGPAAFGDEAKKEAGGTSGMMPIEPLMQFGEHLLRRYTPRVERLHYIVQ